MKPRRAVRAVLKRCAPRRLRNERYRLRIFGPRDYSRNVWRRVTGRAPVPQADVPFDIGAAVPIVLHESTVRAVRSHWVDVGPGMRELDAFRRVAPGHSAFLDIGAAQGIFSAAFCALTGRDAYAFEPAPSMFDDLVALIDANPEFSIKPFRVALGAVAGEQLAQSQGAQLRGVGSVEANTATMAAETMTVDTLDSFVARNGLTPDFVKIDVEGMELEVLRGGPDTFSRSVEVIMLEVHPTMLMHGEAVSDIQVLLDSFGFRLFTLDSAPIFDLADHVDSGRGPFPLASNIVCAKNPAAVGFDKL
jgi:FkbM family methyltransferase